MGGKRAMPREEEKEGDLDLGLGLGLGTWKETGAAGAGASLIKKQNIANIRLAFSFLQWVGLLICSKPRLEIDKTQTGNWTKPSPGIRQNPAWKLDKTQTGN
jgi:hypothetical protein